MVAKTESGFTVVEVVLFLAITGMLFAALMVGVGGAVTQQRYLDSVRSFKSSVQNEFSQVVNTDNQLTGREGGCTATGETSGAPDSPDERDTRGASNCVMLGKAITIDGTRVTTAPVTALDKTSNDISGMSELEAFQAYAPRLSGSGSKVNEVEWGSRLVGVSTASSLKARVLILRSPISGTVRVFTTIYTSPTIPSTTALRSLITEASAVTELSACVDGDSGTMPKQMVKINPRIGGPDAVTIDADAPECQS